MSLVTADGYQRRQGTPESYGIPVDPSDVRDARPSCFSELEAAMP